MLTRRLTHGNIRTMAKMLTVDDVLSRLRTQIAETSLRRTALELGVSAPYLSDVMRGNRSIGRKLCGAMGLKRRVVVTKTITFEKAA
jgi:hypothetical protein